MITVTLIPKDWWFNERLSFLRGGYCNNVFALVVDCHICLVPWIKWILSPVSSVSHMEQTQWTYIVGDSLDASLCEQTALYQPHSSPPQNYTFSIYTVLIDQINVQNFNLTSKYNLSMRHHWFLYTISYLSKERSILINSIFLTLHKATRCIHKATV